MIRPTLNAIPLTEAWPIRKGECYATMNVGQWDALLQAAYFEGWILLEVDANDVPVRAFRKPVDEVMQ